MCPELPPHGSGARAWHTAGASQILTSCTKNPAAVAPAEGPAATLCAVVPKRAPSRPATQPSHRLPRARLGPRAARFLLPLCLPPKHRHSAEDCPPSSSPIVLTSQSSASPSPSPIATCSGASPPQPHPAESSGSLEPELHAAPCAKPSFLLVSLWPASPTTLCLPRGFLLCSPCSGQLKLPCHLP